MNLIDQIKEYIPYNEQEKNDKEMMIHFLLNNADAFDRKNTLAHMTASCFIVNKSLDKVLFCFHNIYQSYSWLGGHADNDKDLLSVAYKEAKEESGLQNIKAYDGNILSLETLCVNGHIKKGKYVSSHIHFNITYLFIADENEELHINEEENSSLKWFTFSDCLKASKEEWFVKNIYPKLIEKVDKIKEEMKNEK